MCPGAHDFNIESPALRTGSILHSDAADGPYVMDNLRSDQVLGLALMVCGVLEFPRICFFIACSWLSWDSVVRLYALLGIYPFLEHIAGPAARYFLLETWRRNY
ncbi:hypothetical protein ColTof4_01600 [Colletotrichum tofieldiae]|nr:hypothetical protein ColTof3_10119 [Colletotrichum tofieldiae]GKT69177.1 hypothetical protein ColTof4_01600 [Colletotrichum tofieldiae]GKT96530.1 hypothetical protein Ct61P_14380 [Colletotrichum tofieldiae]